MIERVWIKRHRGGERDGEREKQKKEKRVSEEETVIERKTELENR